MHESSSQRHGGLRPGTVGVGGIVVLSAVLMGPAISLFFNAPVMAGNAGAAVPLVFVLALVGILFTAGSVAQYSRKISTAGSFYGFVQHSAGRRAGFMAGWATFGAYLGAAVGGVGITGAFIADLLGRHTGLGIPWIFLSMAVAALVIVISVTGLRTSERFSFVMLAIEVVAIIVVVGAVFARGGADGFSAAPFTLAGAEGALNGVRLAMVFGVLSFVGFEMSATMAEETRNPRRAVPRAVVGCTLAVGALYVLGGYAIVVGYGTEHMDQLASDHAAFDTLTARYVTSASIVVDLILINALLGASLAVSNSFARVAFALGRDRVIPAWFGHAHPRFGTPRNALLGLGAAVVIVLAPLAVNGASGIDAYTYVATPASLLLIVVFIVANLTLGLLYRRDYRQEFRWSLHVLTPTLGSLVMLLPITAQFWPKPPPPLDVLPLFALGWLAAGVLVMIVAGRRALRAEGTFAPVEATVAAAPTREDMEDR